MSCSKHDIVLPCCNDCEVKHNCCYGCEKRRKEVCFFYRKEVEVKVECLFKKKIKK